MLHNINYILNSHMYAYIYDTCWEYVLYHMWYILCILVIHHYISICYISLIFLIISIFIHLLRYLFMFDVLYRIHIMVTLSKLLFDLFNAYLVIMC